MFKCINKGAEIGSKGTLQKVLALDHTHKNGIFKLNIIF